MSGPVAPLPERQAPLVVALYLPQFHPSPENDQFWGTGFTEWRSVVAAAPRYEGHRQPRRPGELGFYDLRLADTRAQQAELARSHGIDAFMYYHYWFEGRRVLGRPLDEVLASGEPDFPFCLCWANHDWNRNQNGRPDELLVEQRYSEADDLAHAHFLVTAFADRRYLRVDGRPLFAIYRTQELPDAARTMRVLGEACDAAGVPRPFVVRFETNGSEIEPALHGCDAAAELYPHWLHHHPELQPEPVRVGRPHDWFCRYDDVAATSLSRPNPGWRRYPCVVPDWDTSARRPDDFAWGVIGSTPDGYLNWLCGALGRESAAAGDGPKLVFVNAWNEWSECGYLEPDLDHGRAYLEATRSAVEAVGGRRADRRDRPDRPTEGSSSASTVRLLERRIETLEASYRALLREHTMWREMQPRLIQRAVAEAEGRMAVLRAALEEHRAALLEQG
jgi:hypothetical protein